MKRERLSRLQHFFTGGSEPERSIQTFNPRHLPMLIRFGEAPDPGVLSDLKFSPDGALLAAATENRVLHLWDLRSIRQQLAAMKLDWDLPPLPPLATNQFQGPVTVTILGNTNQPGAEPKP